LKFLIDNALSPSVALALRSEGHNVLHVRDINLQRANDEVIIRRASDEDRILISADTDFGSLLALRGLAKPSFILLRQSNKHPWYQARTILIQLPALQESLLKGCVAVLEDTRIRLRYLPIGSSPEINHTL
jgi:predicted nuclease of predicted toxin-antitoxin system